MDRRGFVGLLLAAPVAAAAAFKAKEQISYIIMQDWDFHDGSAVIKFHPQNVTFRITKEMLEDDITYWNLEKARQWAYRYGLSPERFGEIMRASY